MSRIRFKQRRPGQRAVSRGGVSRPVEVVKAEADTPLDAVTCEGMASLEDVRELIGSLIGENPPMKKAIMPTLSDRGPFAYAAYRDDQGALGAAMGCFHSSTDYATSRIQFDRPIASFQLVQNKLAWMLREITKGQLLAWRLGRMKDAGTLKHEQVSLAKMNNVDIALQIARTARDVHGANGILDEYPIMRHMANLESVYTYEGTHDIHNLVLGKWITGIQAFY